MNPSQKTVLRSVRLPAEVEKILQADAEARGESVNHLIASILLRYSRYGRFAEKFGHVAMSREFFRSLLDALDDDTIARIGEDLGAHLPREISLFWFGQATPETFLQYIDFINRYYRQAQTEVARSGRTVTVKIRHDLGEKYTLFLRHYLAAGAKSLLGKSSETEVSPGMLVLRMEIG
ncbi:MAG: hypothetical protein HY556_04500 [Euryarchaeota archaeon]|nr:hypothetical protein [Euryarchaeota archaeon]